MAKKNVQPVESDVEIITPDAKNKQLKKNDKVDNKQKKNAKNEILRLRLGRTKWAKFFRKSNQNPFRYLTFSVGFFIVYLYRNM